MSCKMLAGSVLGRANVTSKLRPVLIKAFHDVPSGNATTALAFVRLMAQMTIVTIFSTSSSIEPLEAYITSELVSLGW